MKWLDVEQGGPAWLQARLGLPTASRFSEIITPATAKASKSQDKYVAELCAEWLLGRQDGWDPSAFMERGTELEKFAVPAYEWEHDAKTDKAGLCLSDDEKCGASPDRIVGLRGLLETKVPSAAVHMRYYLKPELLREEYHCQNQGQLWVCEREWVDLYSWNPDIPSVRVRVERDDRFISSLEAMMIEFVTKLESAKSLLAPLKAEQVAKAAVQAEADDVFATMDH